MRHYVVMSVEAELHNWLLDKVQREKEMDASVECVCGGGEDNAKVFGSKRRELKCDRF